MSKLKSPALAGDRAENPKGKDCSADSTTSPNLIKDLRAWESVVSASRLSIGAKLVGWGLARRLHLKSGWLNPSQKRLAEDTGLSLNTVKHGIAALEKIGAIAVRRFPGGGRGRSSHYILLPLKTRKGGRKRTPKKGQETTPFSSIKGAIDEHKGGSKRTPNSDELCTTCTVLLQTPLTAVRAGGQHE